MLRTTARVTTAWLALAALFVAAPARAEDLLQETAAGITQAMISSFAAVVGFAQAGKVRRIAISSAQRFPGVDDLPTIGETLPGFEIDGWLTVVAPARTPHFHINLLPEARKMSTTRALMSAYLSYLYRCGEKQVYGQIVTFESRRGEKMFERYGFRVMNRAEITKYRAFYPESVYLSTVIKNLETAEPLSAYTNSSR